jgi:hypothetical protein
MASNNKSSNNISCNSEEMTILEQQMNDYISQLVEKEKIAYEIAKTHLGTSFSLKKSIGFKEWVKRMSQKNESKE